ncbi:stress protein, member of the CspA-family [Legionella cherrii]|uniref:Stress protein, member of the CspA-family n=1 Tax=Legionella cherrii TaxID=28084 RepID=A0A0W0S9A6_9GAMM|nr:stress protein, member of the CspA-family [Legionella cherrii]VEB38643.1 stress protein, member of the CspA-family [Legionella cherrii]
MEESGKGIGTGLVSTAIHYPHLNIVACLIILLMGVLAIFNLPKDFCLQPICPPCKSFPHTQVCQSESKGFGLIENNGKDYFAHFSTIQSTDFKTLSQGSSVLFKAVKGQKGPHAEDVEIV